MCEPLGSASSKPAAIVVDDIQPIASTSSYSNYITSNQLKYSEIKLYKSVAKMQVELNRCKKAKAGLVQRHSAYFVSGNMAPRKKLTEEEKKRRRREQKKQSMRRARAKLDDTAIEERRRKDRERFTGYLGGKSSDP
ncbi:hypothetical protein PYW08_006474 [Mythimna loreyi]|uniref:Uncharacterized protein n=1 Tax=Mythimna loreyi TaxID=667449 RepID=A0ACC2QPQ5_9NEOP|nr:hypothetical protein PYW08_006474 [Mythimna loreyi]